MSLLDIFDVRNPNTAANVFYWAMVGVVTLRKDPPLLLVFGHCLTPAMFSISSSEYAMGRPGLGSMAGMLAGSTMIIFPRIYMHLTDWILPRRFSTTIGAMYVLYHWNRRRKWVNRVDDWKDDDMD